MDIMVDLNQGWRMPGDTTPSIDVETAREIATALWRALDRACDHRAIAALAYLRITELLRAGQTMMLSWVPDRLGNWLFHCHVPEHIAPRGPLREGGRHLHASWTEAEPRMFPVAQSANRAKQPRVRPLRNGCVTRLYRRACLMGRQIPMHARGETEE